MARGTKKDIPDEIKKLVVHLCTNPNRDRRRRQADVAQDLQISLSSVEKILARYRRDTRGIHTPPTLRVRGRPRNLNVMDVDFLIGLVQRTPDTYLYELQEELRELLAVEINLGV
ncbi:hypothetical protein B0H14DRAFT_3450780 [Mycena olivaceomarginata]|nr:hypothetical protein B0H14DRAFT_3450780 [Mycena olivaceomarginata]